MAGKTITELPLRGDLLGQEQVEISQLSDTVRITALTINAAASDQSFNDSGDGFIAAGFQVGDRINVAGFTTPGNNIYAAKITALTAGKITVGGPEGGAMAAEASGQSIVIAKWTSRRAEYGGGGGASRSEVIMETGSSANLDPLKEGKYQRWTSSSPKTLTVQTESAAPLPADGEWHLRNVGEGDLTIAPAAGVDIFPPNGGTLVVPMGGTVTLKRVDVDEFDLLGQTVAEE